MSPRCLAQGAERPCPPLPPLSDLRVGVTVLRGVDGDWPPRRSPPGSRFPVLLDSPALATWRYPRLPMASSLADWFVPRVHPRWRHPRSSEKLEMQSWAGEAVGQPEWPERCVALPHPIVEEVKAAAPLWYEPPLELRPHYSHSRSHPLCHFHRLSPGQPALRPRHRLKSDESCPASGDCPGPSPLQASSVHGGPPSLCLPRAEA